MKQAFKRVTVVMGKRRFLRAVQLELIIQSTVRTMTQWLVEGNAVFARVVLKRLEAGDVLPAFQQNDNFVRRCFASVQRAMGRPNEPRSDSGTQQEILDSRDEYDIMRPPGMDWVDGR